MFSFIHISINVRMMCVSDDCNFRVFILRIFLGRNLGNCNQIIIKSELLLDQMRTFIKTDRKAEAAPHCYDDAVIAMSIAIQMYKFIPEPIEGGEIVVRDYRPSTTIDNLLYKKR